MPSVASLFTAVAASSLIPSASAYNSCPPLGPVLPAPQAPSKHAAVKTAAKGVASVLDEVIGGMINSSAVSIGVKSIHEDKQLFSYHFSPPVTPELGVSEVDEKTIYRVASISKMMPALAALQSSKINMDDSILEYIPELKDVSGSGISATHWEQITVRMLTSHVSGLATDTVLDMGILPLDLWLEMGLPEIPKGTGPSCSGLPGTPPCTRKHLIRDLASRPPVFTPGSTPSYSNLAFTLLGLVVESATGQNFTDYVQENIFDVAGMESTSFDGFVDAFDEHGFIPDGEFTWNGTLGVNEPAGGMFSNTIDLLAFGDAIQKNMLLPAAKTQMWLKPETHTSSAGFSLGAGWEIFRGNNITSDGRLVDVYTKSGDLGLYHSLFGIIPDYDISVSVLTGGLEVTADANSRSRIFSMVVQNLLPAIEAAGKTEANRFKGTYRDADSNATLKLGLESDGGYGLLINEFSVRGFDVLANYDAYNVQTAMNGEVPPTESLREIEGRIIPTKRIVSDNSTTETAWRAIFDPKSDEAVGELNSELFWLDSSCDTVFGLDRSTYNFLSLSEFAIIEDRDGDVQAIKNRAFNVTLTKVRGSHNEGEKASDPTGEAPFDGPNTPQSSGSRTVRYFWSILIVVLTSVTV